MIARHWQGWTKLKDAEAYEQLLKQTVLPGLTTIEGYRGGYVLRNDGPRKPSLLSSISSILWTL